MRVLMKKSVFIIAALVLLSGCLGEGGDTTSSTPAPSSRPQASESLHFNHTEEFLFSAWAQQTLEIGHPLFAYGRPANVIATTGTGKIMVAVADFESRNFDAVLASEKPGHVLDAYAAHVGDAHYILLQMMPDTGGFPMANGWIVFGKRSPAGWNVEDSPLRWQGREIEGMTVFAGTVWALMKGPQGRELWQYASNGWASETVPELDVFWGQSSIAANRTTLFVAGVDALGQPLVLERDNSGPFAIHVLQEPTGVLATHDVQLAIPLEGQPMVAWTTSWAIPTSNENLFDLFTAFRGGTGWEAIPEKLPELMRFQPTHDGATAFVQATLTNGDQVLFRLNGSQWVFCASDVRPAALKLIPAQGNTWLGYMAGPSGGLKKLTDC